MSDLDKLSIDTLRLLAVDAIERAANGHPGAPMALSPLAYLLFTKYMVSSPMGTRPCCSMVRFSFPAMTYRWTT